MKSGFKYEFSIKFYLQCAVYTKNDKNKKVIKVFIFVDCFFVNYLTQEWFFMDEIYPFYTEFEAVKNLIVIGLLWFYPTSSWK